MKILMESRVLQQILAASKTVFSGISEVVQGLHDSQHGAEVFSLHDIRPEVFFVFAEQFPKDNVLLIL